jgi:hypothetical protein
MDFFKSSKGKKHFNRGADMKRMLRDELRADSESAVAGPTAAEKREEEAKCENERATIKKNRNFITRSKTFQAIVEGAYNHVDLDSNGRLSATEIYAAVLLVYVKLASQIKGLKPPKMASIRLHVRQVSGSNLVDREAFGAIAALLFQDIALRVLIHVLMVLFIVPILAARATKYLWETYEVHDSKYLSPAICAQAMTLGTISVLLPQVYALLEHNIGKLPWHRRKAA